MSLLVLAGYLFLHATSLYYPLKKNEPMPINFPDGWPKPNQNFFNQNPITKEGFELGRKLFYDERLSGDNATSCGNCHQQFAAFASLDHDLSHGVHNSFSLRNAPALFNLAWRKDFHWDGGVNHIEVQPLSPLTSAVEMGADMDTVLWRIAADTSYRRMFFNAFGSDQVTSKRMLQALAQFTLSLVSAGSKYDKVKAGNDTFNRFEAKGYEIFKTKCATCHVPPLFTDDSFRNNGLSRGRTNDFGRMAITGKSSDSLHFRVPSLRNVQYSYPYMHDGRLAYLPNVIDHYTNIDTTNPILDPLLRKHISLDKYDKVYLLSFLYTLTDTTFLRDKRFAAPMPITIKH